MNEPETLQEQTDIPTPQEAARAAVEELRASGRISPPPGPLPIADGEGEMPDSLPIGDGEGEAEPEPDATPDLDALLEEALRDSPELKERWIEREEALKQYQADKPALEVLRTYAEAFNDPVSAPLAVRALATQLAEIHGVDVREYFPGPSQSSPNGDYPLAPGQRGLGPEKDAGGNPYEEYERRGWASHGEMELAALTQRQSRTIEQLEKRLQALEGDLNPIREQAERRDFVARETPGVAERLRREYAGFKVTENMVATAVQRYPQHKSDPAKAVEAAYSKAIAQHMSDHAARNSRRGPEMIQTAGGRGRQEKDLSTMSASAAAREAYRQLAEAGQIGH